MPKLQPYGMIMNRRNQNRLHPRAVRTQHVRIDLIADERAAGRFQRETRQARTDAGFLLFDTTHSPIPDACMALSHAAISSVGLLVV